MRYQSRRRREIYKGYFESRYFKDMVGNVYRFDEDLFFVEEAQDEVSQLSLLEPGDEKRSHLYMRTVKVKYHIIAFDPTGTFYGNGGYLIDLM